MFQGSRLVWHYTTVHKLSQILRDGCIKQSTEYVPVGEVPLVWFSSHQDFEPTACKMRRMPDGSYHWLSVDEMKQIGLARIGVMSSELIHWPFLQSRARMSRAIILGLEVSARKRGSNPMCWYGSLNPIISSQWSAIHVMKNGVWVNEST